MLPQLPNNNPAIVNVRTRLLRISQEYWKWLPHIWKVYILYHELGHLNEGKSEEAAERWAIERFIRDGYSAEQIIYAHSQVYPWEGLSEEATKGLLEKTKRSVELAKHFDFHINGNTKLSL